MSTRTTVTTLVAAGVISACTLGPTSTTNLEEDAELRRAHGEITRLERELDDVRAEFARYRADVEHLVELVSHINEPTRTVSFVDGAVSVEVPILMLEPAQTPLEITVATPLGAAPVTVALIFPDDHELTFSFATSDDPNCEQTETTRVCTIRLPALEGQLPGIWRLQLLKAGGPAFEASLSVVLGGS